MEQIKNPSPYILPGLPQDKKPKMWERRRELTLVELFETTAVEIIVGVVSNVTRIPREAILSGHRKKEKVQARHIVMYLCAMYAGELGLKLLAQLLTDPNSSSTRDHSSIIAGRRNIHAILTGNNKGEYADEVIEYLNQIEPQLKRIINESNCTYWKSRQR